MTLYTVMLSAFAVTLSAMTGQEDIVIGTPSDNRHHVQTYPLIGFFVNTIVMRSQLKPECSLVDLLRQMHEEVSMAKTHQDLPFDLLVDALGVERDLSRHPVFQVMFTVQSFGAAEGLQGLPFEIIDTLQISPAKFDLSLFVDDGQSVLSCSLNYALSLFEAGTIERIAGVYERVLEAFVRSPQSIVTEIPLLSEADRTLLDEWNRTEAAYPQDKTLHQLFEEQVARTPEHTALVFENISLTYRELNVRANRLAHIIRRQHAVMKGAPLTPDTLIALYLDRSPEMVIAILAVLKAGGAYVPVAPEYPQERTAFMLEDTGAFLVLTQRHHLTRLEDWSAALATVPCLLAVEEGASVQPGDDANPVAVSGPSDLAYVIYTSGTTGKPKGVEITHQASATRNLFMAHIGRVENNVYLAKTNYVFDVSVSDLFMHLLVGAKVVLAPRDFQLDALPEIIKLNNINSTHFVPSQLSVISTTGIDISPLDIIYTSGENLDNEIIRYFHSNHAIINYYGPTETGEATYYKVAKESDGGIIGRPFDGVKVYVLSDKQKMVPIGGVGELYISGIGQARSYLNRSELTNERFIFSEAIGAHDERIYRTGDIVRWLPNGELQYLGRNDSQVKIRGFRVELAEIENTLMRHGNIQKAIISTQENKGQLCLIAYLVVRNENIDVEEIELFLSSLLPEYMLPAGYITLKKLPLTINGKLDRKALPAYRFNNRFTYAAPRDETEEILCEIWSEVLKRDKTGIDDDFFKVGGSSLKVFMLRSLIYKKIALDNTLSTVGVFNNIAQDVVDENIPVIIETA